METGWSAQQVADALVHMWITVGWWGSIVLGVIIVAIRHGWPWKPK